MPKLENGHLIRIFSHFNSNMQKKNGVEVAFVLTICFQMKMQKCKRPNWSSERGGRICSFSLTQWYPLPPILLHWNWAVKKILLTRMMCFYVLIIDNKMCHFRKKKSHKYSIQHIICSLKEINRKYCIVTALHNLGSIALGTEVFPCIFITAEKGNWQSS